MNNQLPTVQLHEFLDKKLLFPTLPVFNRLEGRPRTHDFDRALRAEVRDALWMLTRQWQLGEFMGDDAGTPVSSKLYVARTMLNKYRPDQHAAVPFDDSLPLETKVEQRRIPFAAGDVEISLDLRLVMGRQWVRLLDKHGFNSALKDAYITHFSVHDPDPTDRADVYYCATPQSWRKHAATAHRHVDGRKLYEDIMEDEGRHVITVGADPGIKSDLIALGKRFMQWFDKLYTQPQDPNSDAWLPAKLEYQFACAAPVDSGDKVFAADAYYQGHLDWYNFSIDTSTTDLGEVTTTSVDRTPIIRSFIPTPVQFDGMPNTRWWAFEEGPTNFGDITPDTTDLNKLLLMEFGLVGANDWYLAPLTLPAGSIADIRGMSVRNVFGENFWITATGAGLDDSPTRWTMYSLDIIGTERRSADLSLIIVPAVPKVQKGKPIEAVDLVRDEVANMVWGIEQRVPAPGGVSVPGLEAARDTVRLLQQIIADSAGPLPEPHPAAAALRYKVMSNVPENWIPFIATHEEDSNRQTRLQRGAMPRVLEGDPEGVQRIKPRTNLLRQGLDQEVKQSYFIDEEEVLRAGITLTQSYQRTRWYNGQVYTWLGVRKRAGRGEAASELRFDYLQPVKPETGS